MGKERKKKHREPNRGTNVPRLTRNETRERERTRPTIASRLVSSRPSPTPLLSFRLRGVVFFLPLTSTHHSSTKYAVRTRGRVFRQCMPVCASIRSDSGQAP